ncbi:hypothetical protein PHYPO_G00147930 [Pangasianodon hypophthalmus]|uniref:Uncharacterized protein n=1 Tax=Pangasianodon hypophthalmus TaxID=310915 RepID=A0A5N5K5C4_PANHP|nr:hypothetical protein PHYPO_G00147930 [Pangasianodon hypophthalmus]
MCLGTERSCRPAILGMKNQNTIDVITVSHDSKPKLCLELCVVARLGVIEESFCLVSTRHTALNRSGLTSNQGQKVCLHQYGLSSVDASLA